MHLFNILGVKYVQINSRALRRLVCVCHCSHIFEMYCQSFDKDSVWNNCQFTSIPDCHLHFYFFPGRKSVFAGYFFFFFFFWRQQTTKHDFLEGLWIRLRPLLQRLKASSKQGVRHFPFWSEIKNGKLLWPQYNSPLAFSFAIRTSFWCSLHHPEMLYAKLLGSVTIICFWVKAGFSVDALSCTHVLHEQK